MPRTLTLLVLAPAALFAGCGVDPSIHQQLVEDYAQLQARVEALEAGARTPQAPESTRTPTRKRAQAARRTMSASAPNGSVCSTWWLRSEIEALPKGVGQPSYDPRCVLSAEAFAVEQARTGLYRARQGGEREVLPMMLDAAAERLRRLVRAEGVDPAWTQQASSCVEGVVKRRVEEAASSTRHTKTPKRPNITYAVACGQTMCAITAQCQRDAQHACDGAIARLEGLMFQDALCADTVAMNASGFAGGGHLFQVFPRRGFKVSRNVLADALER